MASLTSRAERARRERWLLELTDIPTASGHEDRVIAWVERWARRRPHLTLTRDRAGNLLLCRRVITRADRRRRPLYVTAHLDHPAFVVRRRTAQRELETEFRGGVQPHYFVGAAVEVTDQRSRLHRGIVSAYDSEAKPFPRAMVALNAPGAGIRPGDIARWALDEDLPLPRIVDGRLHARACDDLAGVAATLSAYDRLAHDPECGHVRVLFTRAEEVGFIGAIACCRAGTLPPDSAIVCVETSRAFTDSPVGAGPIVRVGDRSGVFSGPLTNAITAIAARHADEKPQFAWQRKLMTGGTCEATAFTAFGYEAACLCMPLANYHNMIGDSEPADRRLGSEIIALHDFHGLVELLVAVGRDLDVEHRPFRSRMDALFDAHRNVLSAAVGLDRRL
ncbi:MAG: M20/M25/M40 family metallo-hydrolase [Acidobacteria bacterium]|nr:M20/M25/M40 family metallo-hydrolase [Acidobacteriota bacterium]